MLENEFMKLKPQLKNEVEHGLILASFDVRNDKELLARINDALDLAPRAKSPDKIIFEPLEYKGEKYVVGFNGELIYAEKLENPKKPTSYDELKALEQKERDDFEDIKTQYEKISEIREKGTTEPNKTLENNTKELDSDNLHENKDILDKNQGEVKGHLEKNEETLKKLPQKTTSKYNNDTLETLPMTTQSEFNAFIQAVANKEYKNIPEVLKIAQLPNNIKNAINPENSGFVYITRAKAAHISISRKGKYNQALRLDEQIEIPHVIQNTRDVYTDDRNGFIIPFNDLKDENKINLIVLNQDEKGNFLITAKKINKESFQDGSYKRMEAQPTGVEPASTTSSKTQSSTESISAGQVDSTANKLTNQEIAKQINTEKQKQNIDENLLKTLRKEMEQELNIKPLEEFGQNYAEHYHNGKAAIDELLKQKQGQVAGAFHREDLGDIDLVWGDSSFGLQHILERRTEQYGEEKALRFISHLEDIIKEGKIVEGRNGKIELITPKSTVILAKKDNHNFIITAFVDSGNKKKLKELGIPRPSTMRILQTSRSLNAMEQTFSRKTKPNTDSTTNPQTNLTKAQAKKQEVLAKKQYKQELSDLKKKLLSAKKDAISFRDKEYDSNVGAGGATVKSSKKGGYVKPLPQDKLSKEKRYRQSLEYFSRENNISYILVDEYIDALNNKQSKEVLEKILQKIHESQKENERALKELQAEADKDIQDFKKSLSNKSIDEIENIYENYKNKHIFDMTQEEKEHRHIVRDALLRLPHTYDINVSNILRVLKGKFLDFKDSDYLLSKDKADAAILQRDRNTIQKHFGINVLRDFGTNYAEFVGDGRGAIQKILLEAKDYEERAKAGKLSDFEISQGQYKGQVAGAFHREDLGDIDLVWGDSSFGLQHILERRTEDFINKGFSKEEAEEMALELVRNIPEIMEKGKLINQNNVRYRVEYNDYVIGLSAEYKGEKRGFIITVFQKNNK